MHSHTERERQIFSEMSVPKAVATLAIPTIISQIVTMIYNLADTFFIGQLGHPEMVAAVSLVSPWFNLLTALGNLFGVGASSLISRLLGAQKQDQIRYASAFSLYMGILSTSLFSAASYIFRVPLLDFLGASPNTIVYAEDYLFWVVVAGGIPTMISIALGHMLRSEGHARAASLGMMAGGILNVILDPILIFAFDLGVSGAAIATAVSNAASVIFFAAIYIHLKEESDVSFLPSFFSFRYARQILSVGFASALVTTLNNVAYMTMIHLSSTYGDIPVAAYGIVKKIDQLPINIAVGLGQGFMPIIGYNYAAGNYTRVRKTASFSWAAAIMMALAFIAVFTIFPKEIMHAFIPDEETSTLGASFLRIACLSIPLTNVNFLANYMMQAMGKGMESIMMTILRQGLLNIPMLIILNSIFGLYGLVWTQFVIEVIMLPVSLGIYAHTIRSSLKRQTALPGM